MKGTKKSSKKQVARDDVIFLIARLFLVSVFVFSLFGKLTNFSGNSAFIGASGFPFPEVLLLVAILLELVGVVSLVLGYKTMLGAKALVVFTVLATLMFHIGAGEEVALLKNLGLIGGLLLLMVTGPGKYSLDHKN